MSCKIKIKRHNDVPVIKIIGELAGGDSAGVSKKILAHGNVKTRKVVIDLSETTFIDSHGLGALVYAWKMLENGGKELVLLDPPSFFHTILGGTNLSSLIKVIDSLESL